MKKHFSFRQMPNVFTTVSRHCNGTTLLLLFALSLGFSSNAWADGIKEQGREGWQAGDTAYVVTPTISTQDTLYLKYEDAKATVATWWERYGCQAILLTIIGAGITLFTTWVTNKQKRKRRKQDKKDEQATDAEKNIYKLIVALRNAGDDSRAKVMRQLTVELQEAELTMRTPLYLTAAQILTLYQNGEDSDALNQLPEEQKLLEQYKKQFRGEI